MADSTIRDWLRSIEAGAYGPEQVTSAGTSEGVRKAWDTRGRGQHARILKQNGFKKLPNEKDNLLRYQHPDKGIVAVRPSGSWAHHYRGLYDHSAVGDNAQSLHEHLTDFNPYAEDAPKGKGYGRPGPFKPGPNWGKGTKSQKPWGYGGE